MAIVALAAGIVSVLPGLPRLALPVKELTQEPFLSLLWFLVPLLAGVVMALSALLFRSKELAWSALMMPLLGLVLMVWHFFAGMGAFR